MRLFHWALGTLLALLLTGASAMLAAQTPTRIESVLDSSLRHFPRILAAQADIDAARAEVLAAEGSFDPRIDGALRDRWSGYYSGDYLDLEFVQRLPFMNTRLFGGYELGEGSFPVYENSLLTRNGGEVRAGIAISLWRNRDIDAARAALEARRIDVTSSAQDLTREKLDVVRDAYVTYAQWLLSARLLQAWQSLLDIAVERGTALETRVAEGDAAEILLVENRQTVLQREALVMEARRQFEVASEWLTLYLRDANGAMLRPVYDATLELPPENAELLTLPPQQLAAEVLARRPEIRMLELERDQAELKERLAENSMKPQVDLRFYGSRDQGSGPLSLAGTEQVADIRFSIPLRTREASGKAAAARAEIRNLDQRIRMLSEQLETGIRRAQLNLEATRELERLAIEELAASEALAEAEVQRFEAGLSDFFLLNLRERQMGEAQLKRWQAHLAHQVALADFYAATMHVEGFGVEERF